MSLTGQFISRVWNSAVFWTWIFSGLRMASGLLLLPLLLWTLNKQDLGMYYNFLYLTGLLGLLDLSVSVGIARNISYAMSGAKDLKGIGMAEVDASSGPNLKLLGQLLSITRKVYGSLCLVITLMLGLAGTFSIHATISQTSWPLGTWLAWMVLVVAAPLELYTSSWLVVLRGLNRVVLSARLSAVVYFVKLILSCLLLLVGLKLLAVPIATILTAIFQRILARHHTMKSLPEGVMEDSSQDPVLWKHLWPTTWRLGLLLLSGWVMTNTFLGLISRTMGLAANAQFALSYQALYTICVGLSVTWTYVKWPIVTQYRASNDLVAVRRVLFPRLWLQLLTFIFLAAFVVVCGPPLLKYWNPDKQLLPRVWLALFALYSLLEMHMSFWTALLSTENRIPSLWAVVITHAVSVGLAVTLFKWTDLQLGAFVLSPLVCTALFNCWFWPAFGARSIGTTWVRFMLGLDRGLQRTGANP